MKTSSHRSIAKGVWALIALIAIVVPGVILIPAGASLASDVSGDGVQDACPVIVQRALTVAAEGCDATGRNEVCYGHTNLEAQPQASVDSFEFTEAGDIVDVADMRSLRLGHMNEGAGTWGIALLRLQANLPANSTENVTLVLFGDTAIEDATPSVVTMPVHAAVQQNVNLRAFPDSAAAVLGTLAPGVDIVATGRLDDGSWLRVAMPETGEPAWAFAGLMAGDGDLELLDVVSAGTPYFGPMQAFTLNSGVDDAPCAEAPQSGLVIQTPQGMGQVRFLINEVDIQMSSTVFVQAAPGNRMDINVVNGTASVTAGGVTQTIQPGMVVSIPLSSDSTAAGRPSVPRPYDPGTVQALPVVLVPDPVTIAPPYTPAPMVAQPSSPTTGSTGTTSTTGSTSTSTTTGSTTTGGTSTGGTTDPAPTAPPPPPPPEPTQAPCKPKPGNGGDPNDSAGFCP